MSFLDGKSLVPRLDRAFRTNTNGEYSADIYRANLAILEARIKGLDKITALPINEELIQQDLNRGNTLGGSHADHRYQPVRG
ncbi:MAG: hypothetical protein AB8B86_14125 [Pseudomonadales bacterium]